jgi:predicted  nucleic acid-binding Zn-ribbon protein
MEVRGERECTDCGTRWSYYETGSPACPACGSLQSVGVGEREFHTDRPADLDLQPALAALADERYREAGDAAGTTAREYVRRRGFIDAGALRPLEDRYLAAAEIRHVAQLLRLVTPAVLADGDLDLDYVEGLLSAAEAGERPAAESVPSTMAGPRGLGVADAVSEYRDALKQYQERTPGAPDLAGPLDRLDGHLRRLEALDGAIEPESAEKLVSAARAIGDYAREATAQTDPDRSAVERALDSLG